MFKSRNFQKAQLSWIIISIILLFSGLVLSSLGFAIGQFLLVVSGFSIILYIIVSVLQWFKFKKGNGLKNLETAYILLSTLLVIGGLVGALLTYPDGMSIFITGVIMLALFWFFKLIQFIFMKEEDFL